MWALEFRASSADSSSVNRAVLISLAAALFLNTSALAEPVRVPGTGIRMDPPAGFSRADRFPGFQQTDQGASIMVTEIEGPAAEVRRGMTRKSLASRGMTLIESRVVKVEGGEALLLHVSQKAQGIDYGKWMLVGGSRERTIIVVGTFPSAASDLSESIRRALLTVSWTGKASADLFESLTFRVDATPKMRLADRMGNMLLLTESGNLDSGDPNMAILVVGASISETQIDDLEAFSKERVAKIDRLENVQNLRGAKVHVDDLTGYELTARGIDPKNQRSVGLYQLLLADGNSYYVAQGFVASGRMEEVLPTFRRVMDSFHRVAETDRIKITR